MINVPKVLKHPDCLMAMINFLSYHIKPMDDDEHISLIVGVIQDVITRHYEEIGKKLLLECEEAGT